jgi:hypothetical protein
MARALLPGRWNRHGRAIPDNHLSELDIVLPPPITHLRLVPEPKPEPVHQRPRRKPRGTAFVIAMVALIAFGAIVLLAPVQSGQAVATLFVGPR